MRGGFGHCLWSPRVICHRHSPCPGGGIQGSQVALPLLPQTYDLLGSKAGIFTITKTLVSLEVGGVYICTINRMTGFFSDCFSAQGTHKHQETFVTSVSQRSTLAEGSIWTQHLFPSLELFIWKYMWLLNSWLGYRDPTKNQYINTSVL